MIISREAPSVKDATIANEGTPFSAKANQMKAKDVFLRTFVKPTPNPKYSRLSNYNKKRWPKQNTKRKQVNFAKRGKRLAHGATESSCS